MKNEKHQEAKHLYFQTGMTKTEIANLLNVNRRTILLWCKQGNWDNLRMSARIMPAIVAEKCYYLIDHFTSHLMTHQTGMSSLSTRDALTIHLLASSIKKLKTRSTVNESMEMFNYFLEGVKKKDPKMAADMLPHIEDYISSRKDVRINDFMLDEFQPDGYLPYPDEEIKEGWADEKDMIALNKEYKENGNFDQTLSENPSPEPPKPGPQDA